MEDSKDTVVLTENSISGSFHNETTEVNSDVDMEDKWDSSSDDENINVKINRSTPSPNTGFFSTIGAAFNFITNVIAGIEDDDENNLSKSSINNDSNVTENEDNDDDNDENTKEEDEYDESKDIYFTENIIDNINEKSKYDLNIETIDNYYPSDNSNTHKNNNINVNDDDINNIKVFKSLNNNNNNIRNESNIIIDSIFNSQSSQYKLTNISQFNSNNGILER